MEWSSVEERYLVKRVDMREEDITKGQKYLRFDEKEGNAIKVPSLYLITYQRRA